MAFILKPPAPLVVPSAFPSLFLAGSIEMGAAPPWQATVEAALHDLDVLILNPRRDEWEAHWEQTIHHALFREQVEWELEAQEQASLIGMFFAPDTRAPVTLLELGLAARSGKLVVGCPDGFWRKGNVEIVCARYDIPLVTSLDALIAELRLRLGAEAEARRLQPGEAVIWWKRLPGGDYVTPILGTVLELTAKRVKIQADDDGETVIRYVSPDSLQRRE